jgi:hypothetical protein
MPAISVAKDLNACGAWAGLSADELTAVEGGLAGAVLDLAVKAAFVIAAGVIIVTIVEACQK